jgi:ribosomal protein S18 acetylase RimI-like enzyme
MLLIAVCPEMPMETRIRDWNRADLPQIQRAWLDFCRQAARSDMRLKSEADRAMMDWLISRFTQPATFGLIAEQSNKIAGFLIGRLDEWECVPPVIEPRKLGIIDAVHVNEEFRRQGIGTQLIEEAVNMFRDRKAVAVETIYDAWSEASINTWHHLGFAPWMVHAFRLL